MRAFVRFSRTRIADQRGIVLYASLMLLALIMAVGVQAIVSTRSNFQITSNLTAENVAFYLSEAGIEWSKNELAHTRVQPPEPLNALLTISSGTFSVATVSTVAVSPMVSNMVIRSTGRFASSSQIIQAELIKRYLLADAAIGLRGHTNRAILVGDLFSISGVDHDPTTGKPVARDRPYAGITVSSSSAKQRLEIGLESTQLAKISGSGRDGARISESESLSGEAIVRFSDHLCSAGNAQRTTVSSGTPTTLRDQTWGSRSMPELRCFEGHPGPGDSLILTGKSSGAGILIVRDAEVILEGAFRWEGLILVTGGNAIFRVLDASSKEILGGVIINETGGFSESNPPSVDVQGAIKILFSRSALQNAATVVPVSVLNDSYPSLPSEVVQNYWKLLTPQH
jgi:hypothetical protein